MHSSLQQTGQCEEDALFLHVGRQTQVSTLSTAHWKMPHAKHIRKKFVCFFFFPLYFARKSLLTDNKNPIGTLDIPDVSIGRNSKSKDHCCYGARATHVVAPMSHQQGNRHH